MCEKDKALEVYDKLFESTESFEPIALYVCYLIPAILRNDPNDYIDLNMGNYEDREFHKLLSNLFPKDHFVWNHIKIYKE